MNEDQVRATVREHYARVASNDTTGCAPGCCGPAPEHSRRLGYSESDLADVPEGANLGLGCGNPRAIAALSTGETVLDLGSGGGFDSFLAARQVGDAGRVIGVDMTAEMITKARSNAGKIATTNVEFRLGEIEHLPVADASVDVILSNCVINLSPNKAQVFRDAFRVLKVGGRLAISDVVLLRELPPELRDQALALSACIAGAATIQETRSLLEAAGFSDISVTVNEESKSFIADWSPGSGAESYIASASIEAKKLAASCCAPSCCGGAAE